MGRFSGMAICQQILRAEYFTFAQKLLQMIKQSIQYCIHFEYIFHGIVFTNYSKSYDTLYEIKYRLVFLSFYDSYFDMQKLEQKYVSLWQTMSIQYILTFEL